MKKPAIIKLILLLIVIGYRPYAQAQTEKPKGMEKMVKGTEKVNQSAGQMNENMSEMNNQVQQANSNVMATVESAKAIIKVFEPIMSLYLKKKKPAETASEPVQETSAAETAQESVSQENVPSDQVTYTDITNGTELYTESPAYNTDGTANLGNQNHKEYGCYIDITRGLIMDDVDVADKTASVDLIFTATEYFGSATMYALLTPAYVKNDFFSNYYFRGPNYKDANIPVKQWDEVNECEIALTALTPTQFDKIKDNNQLMAVVKRAGAFKDKYESRTKIEGKVFAIKTEMGNRTAYGLMHVVNQFGTTGANGYLKIRLKVTGFDSNSDGYPDAGIYRQ